VLNIYESKTSELKNQLRVSTETGIGGTATVSYECTFLPVAVVECQQKTEKTGQHALYCIKFDYTF